MPFLSMIRIPLAETRRRTKRFSLSTQKRWWCRFGRKTPPRPIVGVADVVPGDRTLTCNLADLRHLDGLSAEKRSAFIHQRTGRLNRHAQRCGCSRTAHRPGGPAGRAGGFSSRPRRRVQGSGRIRRRAAAAPAGSGQPAAPAGSGQQAAPAGSGQPVALAGSGQQAAFGEAEGGRAGYDDVIHKVYVYLGQVSRWSRVVSAVSLALGSAHARGMVMRQDDADAL